MAQNRGLWQTIVDGLIASEGAMGLNRWIDMLTGTLPLKLLFACSLLVGYGERLSLYMSQMTHSAEAYSSFHSMKQLYTSINTPPMGCQSNMRLPSSISSGFPDNFSVLNQLHSRVERGTMRVNCFPQEHNTMTWSYLEPRPIMQESYTLTIKPLALPLWGIV